MSFKIKARAIREIFHKDNYWIIAFIPTESNRDIKLNQYGNFSCCGDIGYITINKDYELELEEGKASKYGMSYNILSVPSMQMEDLNKLTYEEKFDILMECTSSERIAKNILTSVPDYIELAVTKGADAIDTSKIKGVGATYNQAYCRILIDKYKYYSFCMDSKRKYYKLSISDAKALFDKWSTVEEIDKNLKENPYYCLIEICRHSFNKVDEFLMEIRPELEESDERVEALELEILRRNEVDGSTRLLGNVLCQVIKDDYPKCSKLIPRTKEVAVNSELIYFDEDSKDLSIMATYIAECNIADFVMRKNINPHVLDIDWKKYTHLENGFDMSEKQSKALEMFCNYDVMLLCGFSGTGKTTSVSGLINLMEDNGISYTLLSTTGKAARVLSQSTNRPAMTIHRRCFTNEITTDALIVDEMSLASLDTFTMLLKNITNPDCKVVFVFDSAQLCPIGSSKIATDLLDSGKVPFILLDEVFRYRSNGALFVATNIRNGVNFFNDDTMVKNKGNVYTVSDNYKFIDLQDEDEIFETVVKEYRKLLDKGIKRDDIMIATPMNVGAIGTYRINNYLQAELNPPRPNEMVHERKVNGVKITFRVGDRVVNKKNDYKILTAEGYRQMQDDTDHVLTEDDVDHSIVLNGQLGTIVEVNKDGLMIRFDEEILFFSKLKINNLLLGATLSVHSLQGSTVDYCINIVSNSHKRMLCKELLYVADTRMRKKQIDIGNLDAFIYGIGVSENAVRKTWEKELIEKWSDNNEKISNN